MKAMLDLNDLIDVVSAGCVVRSGVDIYNNNGLLLLRKDKTVRDPNILKKMKINGVKEFLLDTHEEGGIWDKDGYPLSLESEKKTELPGEIKPDYETSQKVEEIREIKQLASEKYENAKICITQVIKDIRKTGGKFDYKSVEHTTRDILDFLTRNENAFSYMTRELFSYDDYLYTHSVNVCTIGCAILNRFNKSFSQIVNKRISGNKAGDLRSKPDHSFRLYMPDELHQIVIGFFLHDIGKVMIPEKVLNKTEKLSEQEFDLIKTHSYLKGKEILEKNTCINPFIMNTVMYHHGLAYHGDWGCYPLDKDPSQIPFYVKICKLADIYDAMTSKRPYKDAVNPIGVVTNIFRRFQGKDNMLTHVLHSFVKSIGIHPPGSITTLTNGQLAYVLDSNGPLVIPFTSKMGETIQTEQKPIDLSFLSEDKKELAIDSSKPLIHPKKAYEILPDYLRSEMSSGNQ